MRKLFFLAVTIIFAGLVQAQVKSGADNRQNNQAFNVNFEKHSEELQLTEAQKAEILAIHEKYADKRETLRSTGTQADFMALRDAKQKEIEAVLNEEQIQKMQKIKIQEEKDNKAKEFKRSEKRK